MAFARAAIADKKLVRVAVHDGEGAADGAVHVHSASKWSVFDEQAHKCFLSESSAFVIQAEQVA